jgi:hypothetical protein
VSAIGAAFTAATEAFRVKWREIRAAQREQQAQHKQATTTPDTAADPNGARQAPSV